MYKNKTKNWKLPFSKVQNICFDLNVVLKPFSKMLSMSSFEFTQFCMLCLAFPKNSFNLVTEIWANKLKTPFSDAQSICLWLQGSFKTNFFWRIWFAFPENGLNFVTRKFNKKSEKCHIWTLRTIVFYLQVASKPFSKILPATNFGLNLSIYFLYFWRLWFSRMVSTSSVKNVQKIKKMNNKKIPF